jgi:hypothetical protein
MASRWSWQAFQERRRRRIERWRGRNWPVVTGAVAFFIASQALEDADGDTSITAALVAAALGLAVYAVAELIRRALYRQP